jgi:hypothetical protein
MKPQYPLLYVAGPYRGRNREAVDLNIQTAKRVGALASEKGYACIVPHMNTAHLDQVTDKPDAFWLGTTMEMLRVCKAVVLCPGWKNSIGTLAEIEEAGRLGLPVFTSVDDMPDAYSFNLGEFKRTVVCLPL